MIRDIWDKIRDKLKEENPERNQQWVTYHTHPRYIKELERQVLDLRERLCGVSAKLQKVEHRERMHRDTIRRMAESDKTLAYRYGYKDGMYETEEKHRRQLERWAETHLKPNSL